MPRTEKGPLESLRERVRQRRRREAKFAPLPRTSDYVTWKLGVSPDSFHGTILRAIAQADGNNRAILSAAWPHLVAAYEAWEASPTGEFEVPAASARHRAFCGCEVGAGLGPLTTGQLRAHRLHTGAAMAFWVVLIRKGVGQDFDATNELMSALRAFGEMLDRLFPESAG